MKNLALALLMFALAGCAALVPQPPTPVYMQSAYSMTEHFPYMKTGEALVTGQAFLRQQGGGVVTCAGSDVMLMPATTYFREVWELAKLDRPIEGVTPQAQTVVKRTKCDAQGNFELTNVPAGHWLIGTEVKWFVGYGQQGGALGREIDVPASGTVKIFLGEADFVAR